VLGPSEGGLGGQEATDGFPVSRRNAYLSGANAFFADVLDIFRSSWTKISLVSEYVNNGIVRDDGQKGFCEKKNK